MRRMPLVKNEVMVLASFRGRCPGSFFGEGGAVGGIPHTGGDGPVEGKGDDQDIEMPTPLRQEGDDTAVGPDPAQQRQYRNISRYGSGYRLPCARRGSGTSANAARRLENGAIAPSHQGACYRFRLFGSEVDSFSDRKPRTDSSCENIPYAGRIEQSWVGTQGCSMLWTGDE